MEPSDSDAIFFLLILNILIICDGKKMKMPLPSPYSVFALLLLTRIFLYCQHRLSLAVCFSLKTTTQNVELVNSLIVVLQPSSKLLASRHMLLFHLAIIFL